MVRGISLLVAGLLVFGYTGKAEAIAGMHVGVKGGMNIANQSSSDSSLEPADSRNGMALGGWVQLPVAPMFSVQPEAYFTMKGDSQTASGVTGTIKMDYLEVPVLAKATFGPPASPISPSLFAGPSFGINLSSKAEISGTGTSADGTTDVKDVTKSTDIGVVLGGGLEFGNVGIDVRYTKGLTNIDNSGSGADVKNNVLSILGSFRFF